MINDLTPKQVAALLGVSYPAALSLIRGGRIRGVKEKGKWSVPRESLDAFKQRNRKAIDNLQKEYVSLYWQGLTIRQLQKRVSEDFAKRGIAYREKGFAETAIYENLMKGKTGK